MGELFALSTTCLCLEAIVIKNVKNRLRQQLNMNISWDEADFNVLAPLLLEPLLGKEDSRVLAPPHLDPLFGQAPANRDKYVVKALETALEEISTADTSFPYTARSRLVFNITFGDILSKADPSHWRPSGARWNPEAFRLLLRSKPTGYSTEDLGTLMDPTYLYSHLLLYDGPAHGDQGYFHDEDLPFIIAANAGFPYPSTIVHAQDFLPGLIPYPEDFDRCGRRIPNASLVRKTLQIGSPVPPEDIHRAAEFAPWLLPIYIEYYKGSWDVDLFKTILLRHIAGSNYGLRDCCDISERASKVDTQSMLDAVTAAQKRHSKDEVLKMLRQIWDACTKLDITGPMVPEWSGYMFHCGKTTFADRVNFAPHQVELGHKLVFWNAARDYWYEMAPIRTSFLPLRSGSVDPVLPIGSTKEFRLPIEDAMFVDIAWCQCRAGRMARILRVFRDLGWAVSDEMLAEWEEGKVRDKVDARKEAWLRLCNFKKEDLKRLWEFELRPYGAK
ncbi:hypothetical protein EX30DRAFT_340176 [Ascodesmis nigricans]|uniref:Uncharacterized protein n=1 Tax=Ascodesmis nigricans TaxID=341454 RepID=A0A4S2MZX4_9PEZI|nr:hypothetical protein EX30DRAFT_340176 [Ascodesmis nigricans]